MAGFTPYTYNFADLSDENGYPFEFRCDICGSGYRSEFIRSSIGAANALLSGASSLIGGFFNSASSADRVNDFTDRGARDEAMQQETVFSGDTSARQTVCVACQKPVGSEKFCSNCGTPTGQNTCGQCGAELPSGARFCGNCGTKAF